MPDVTLAEFGPFADSFEKGELSVPGYLLLLGMQEAAAHVVIDRIERAMEADLPQPWVGRLLADANWRPHLVGCIAFLVDRAGVLDPELLWGAIDRGSWVIPQLVVTALFADSTFADRARSRVAELCPVSPPGGLSPAERHSATGPGGPRERSAKMLASLLEVSSHLPSLAEWSATVRHQREVQELLRADAWDDSPWIVAGWLGRVQSAFRERGINLAPKAA